MSPKLFPFKHFLNQTASAHPFAHPVMTDASKATSPGPDPARHPARSTDTRGKTRFFWDLVFGAIRGIRKRAHNFYATFGIFVVVGGALALTGTYLFARLAGHVTSGKTQEFDEAVLRWMGERQSPTVEHILVEITLLGTGSVVITMVAVSSLFLWLTRHKYSALLLLVATVGGILLNNLLKIGFGRPRPQLFDWGTQAVTLSFPSGHAMSSAVVYGCVAYLAARLQRRRWHRVVTMLAAGIIIVLISVSRLYLGVHYPSDVAAGVIIGLAWAAFCMATLEAIQIYGRSRAPDVARNEAPPPKAT
jgi:undecaprenyl-diphosphatase